MNIPIYKAEIQDGLADAIKANASIAYVSPVSTYIPSRKQEEAAKVIAYNFKAEADNKDQFDLYYINSVLVSTGCNKNDDVFDLRETWAARKSPEDKQFNFMHDETDIIGHITSNIVVDQTGNVIPDEAQSETLPDKFDIITSSVLYNSWTDPKLSARMEKLIAEIEEGKWFVSMEALFNGFDFAIVDPQGNNKTIARNEESAFLTKYLRVYGGEGEYEGHKIGRLLRNITFSGKGLVSNPANPRSVIITDADPFLTSEAYAFTQSSLRENQMSDMLEKQVADLKAELVEAKSASEALKAEISSQKDEEFKTKIEAFEAAVAEKEAIIVQLNETVEANTAKTAELEESLAAVQTELEAAQAQILAHEAEVKAAARKALLAEAGFDEEEAEEALAKFAEVSDELFEEFAGYMKKKAKFPPKKDDEEDEEKDDEVEASEEEAEAEVVEEVEAEETDEAEAEAETEVLEDVEEEAEASMADAGDNANEARTSASNWLESNVLRTTAGLQE